MQQQMGGSPLLNAPHLIVPPHHQPQRLSPLPHHGQLHLSMLDAAYCVSPIMATSPNTLTVHHPGVPARIPSPRELVAHTQSIMQNALIKKKLEEQRENFRRRNEQAQGQHQPSKQATPISFTPTSVLRKMTAEKESDVPSPKQQPAQQQWAQPPKVPQGRPIVKGNQSGAPPMNYTQSPSDYQHHYINQQQVSGVGMSATSGAIRGSTALHQLLIHTHQRNVNDHSGVALGSVGADNQLARWFSPELLAQASAGKLPSVHVPNALSLEELERAHHSPAVRN
ncbi:hypothetical protein EVAR_94900_1 [Eumeta japonica]|uniref:Uncharacterized protein n=1 Tax=Eumeta variegata TaxID=151549 RepID=A0A4C1V9A3_EUMVA|nr:hypothetical protein EVAR_94900_1 [Eumeta japonica]